MVVLEIERSIDRRSERIAVWVGLKSGNKTHVGAAGERIEESARERERERERESTYLIS
jgi:hypothetical protein